jgi:hypothetical protein
MKGRNSMMLKTVVYVVAIMIVAGCSGAATTVTTVPPTTAPSSAQISEQDALALADKFYDLSAVQHDYAGAYALFDEQMKAAITESKLAELWATLPQQVGAFQSRSAAALADRKDPYQRVIIPLQYEKAALNMLVVVDVTTGKISGLFFQPNQDAQSKQYKSPAYVDAARFEEKDVTFGAAPWSLPGTLTLPKGTGPFPAVVLVHGSGPNDRDETIGPNKPFKDIAQGLASQGIAVLRYDKRTKVYQMEVVQDKEFTANEETVDDAAAAVEFLRSQAQIDPKQVFVAGHSLGGYLAPRIGLADANIAGMIIMAGLTRSLEDVMLEQPRYILEGDGSLSADDQAKIGELQKQVDAVKALTSQNTEAVLGAPASYWLDLKDYRPTDLARGLQMPLLIMQGERDYQVTMQDFKNWQDALSGQANVTLKSYPGLNHLFMAGEAKSLPAEYEIPSNVAPEIVRDIASWIQQQN